MPHYYFDILHDEQRVTRDHRGTDLPDLEAAEIEAMMTWKRIIAERAVGGEDPLNWHVLILGPDGALLAKVPHPEHGAAMEAGGHDRDGGRLDAA